MALVFSCWASVLNAADTRIWDVDGSDTWNQAGNWSGGSPNSRTEIAEFGNQPTATAVTVTVNTSRTIHGLSFTGTTTAYTISVSGTRSLTFRDESNGGADPFINVTGSQANTISGATLSLEVNSDSTSDLSISNSSTAATGLTIAVPLMITGTDNQTINFGGTGKTVVSGVIQDEADTGILSLTKTGSGTLVFTADNTYDGTTTISAGILESQIVSGLGVGGVTLSGGTFSVTTVDQTYGQIFTLSADSTVDVASGRTFTLGDAANDLTGAGKVTKTGAGTLLLGFSNDHSGGFGINVGTMLSTASGALGTGNVTLGGGTLSVTTANQSYGQTFTVSSASTIDVGTGVALTLGNAANDLTGGGKVTKTGTGTLSLGFSNNHTGGFDINAGTVVSTASGGVGTGNVTLGGGTLSVTTANQSYGQTFTVSSASTIDVGAGVTFTLGDTANDLTGSGKVTKTGTGTLSLGFSNDHSGGFDINASTVLSTASGALGSGNVTLAGSTLSVTTASQSYGQTFTVSSASTIDVGTGVALTLGNAADDLTGGGKVTKTGTGTLSLGFSNNHTGGFDINAGTVVSTASGGVGTGNLTLSGGSLLLGVNNGISTGSTVTMAGGTLNTQGFDHSGIGVLSLANNSYLDMAGVNTFLTDKSVISFADSSATSWTVGSTLYIQNWTGIDTVGHGTQAVDQVYFGTTASGLTAAQLGQIIFVNPYMYTDGSQYVGNLGAIILANGEVVPYRPPVPEARTVVLTALLGGAILVRERRRLGAGIRRLCP